jgi:hypothetical protein
MIDHLPGGRVISAQLYCDETRHLILEVIISLQDSTHLFQDIVKGRPKRGLPMRHTLVKPAARPAIANVFALYEGADTPGACQWQQEGVMEMVVRLMNCVLVGQVKLTGNPGGCALMLTDAFGQQQCATCRFVLLQHRRDALCMLDEVSKCGAFWHPLPWLFPVEPSLLPAHVHERTLYDALHVGCIWGQRKQIGTPELHQSHLLGRWLRYGSSDSAIIRCVTHRDLQSGKLGFQVGTPTLQARLNDRAAPFVYAGERRLPGISRHIPPRTRTDVFAVCHE